MKKSYDEAVKIYKIENPHVDDINLKYDPKKLLDDLESKALPINNNIANVGLNMNVRIQNNLNNQVHQIYLDGNLITDDDSVDNSDSDEDENNESDNDDDNGGSDEYDNNESDEDENNDDE